MLCFGYLCTNVIVLYFMSIVLGGGGNMPVCREVGVLIFTGLYGSFGWVPCAEPLL